MLNLWWAFALIWVPLIVVPDKPSLKRNISLHKKNKKTHPKIKLITRFRTRIEMVHKRHSLDEKDCVTLISSNLHAS
jgi:hypothetical protein